MCCIQVKCYLFCCASELLPSGSDKCPDFGGKPGSNKRSSPPSLLLLYSQPKCSLEVEEYTQAWEPVPEFQSHLFHEQTFWRAWLCTCYSSWVVVTIGSSPIQFNGTNCTIAAVGLDAAVFTQPCIGDGIELHPLTGGKHQNRSCVRKHPTSSPMH